MNNDSYNDGFRKRILPCKCPYCEYIGTSIKSMTNHIRKYHKDDTLGVLKCRICGADIRFNKTGCCPKHVPRNGKDNPFYGKTHSKETIENSKKKISESSKQHWQNPEYREKVIKGISKPRPEKFKKEQSKRIKQWYQDNPVQRELRSKHMKNTWKTNKIHQHPSSNESQAERDFIEQVKHNLMDVVFKKETLILDGHIITPDYIYRDWENGNFIVEFYGDHWHANPIKYQADDIINPTNKTAKEIWQKDKERIELLEKHGYKVYIVWESDLKDEEKMQAFWETLEQDVFKY